MYVGVECAAPTSEATVAGKTLRHWIMIDRWSQSSLFQLCSSCVATSWAPWPSLGWLKSIGCTAAPVVVTSTKTTFMPVRNGSSSSRSHSRGSFSYSGTSSALSYDVLNRTHEFNGHL